MITTVMKNNATLRAVLLLSVSVFTSMMLVIGMHISGISPIPSAHAAAVGKAGRQVPLQTPCTSDPTGPHCNNQDPMAQGCYRDARTLSYIKVINKQGVLLATVQRRYSPICSSEWGRILEVANNHQPIGIVIAKNGMRSTPGPVAFSTMVFIPNLSVASEITGIVSTNGIAPYQIGSQGLAVSLPALPAIIKK